MRSCTQDATEMDVKRMEDLGAVKNGAASANLVTAPEGGALVANAVICARGKKVSKCLKRREAGMGGRVD